jgi:hypothetical protein
MFRTRRSAESMGDLLFAIGLSSLAPLEGAILLLTGESIRLLRRAGSREPEQEPSASSWPQAIREEAAKWGLLVTMIVFSITLKDSLAELLAGTSVVVWALLKLAGMRKRIA